MCSEKVDDEFFTKFGARIQKLFLNADDDPATVDELYIDFMEEVGEVATCLSVNAGRKPASKISESAREECVDVIIAAMIVYRKSGGDLMHLASYFKKKAKKYAGKVEFRCAESSE